MTKADRSRLIMRHVASRDEKFGKNLPLRGSDATSKRRISDDPRWEALITRGHRRDSTNSPINSEGAATPMWDLLQVFVYGELRVTAHFRGNDVDVQYYTPGSWEPIFLICDSGDTTPLYPAGNPLGGPLDYASLNPW